MSASALTASAGRRLMLGVLVCVPLVAATVAVEWPRPELAALTQTVTDLPLLELASTAPVTRWQVLLGERDVIALASDRQQWRGILDAPAGTVVRIRVETTHPGTPRALRARIGALPERSAWSDDVLTLVLTVPAH